MGQGVMPSSDGERMRMKNDEVSEATDLEPGDENGMKGRNSVETDRYRSEVKPFTKSVGCVELLD